MVEEGETMPYANCYAMGGVVSDGVIGANFQVSDAIVGQLRVGVLFCFFRAPKLQSTSRSTVCV